MFIALDRQERGLESDLSAVNEVRRRHHIAVVPIVTLQSVITFLAGEARYRDSLSSIAAYREKYGT